MDIPKGLEYLCKDTIHCVDMHTTGEPTRIIYKGYPPLTGTLLQQRAQAQSQYDHIRKQLMWEPRGHREMYGAILRRDTELTGVGKAHIGVLFTTNEGYSTMCGHATIALGRFLVDTQDLEVFPRRNQLQIEQGSNTVRLNLHAPCGLIKVAVPVKEGGKRADASRPVAFLCVPSFVSAVDEEIEIPKSLRWPELDKLHKISVQLSIAYGGAFFCIVRSVELGLGLPAYSMSSKQEQLDELLRCLPAMEKATNNLKLAINQSQRFRDFIQHPQQDELSFLYSTIVEWPMLNRLLERNQELGICFFGDQQLDRSPTGSGVAARLALANCTSDTKRQTYHSLISFRELVNRNISATGTFTGTVVYEVKIPDRHGRDIDAVLVKVEGYAYYTSFHTFVVEPNDNIGRKGFLLDINGKLQ